MKFREAGRAAAKQIKVWHKIWAVAFKPKPNPGAVEAPELHLPSLSHGLWLLRKPNHQHPDGISAVLWDLDKCALWGQKMGLMALLEGQRQCSGWVNDAGWGMRRVQAAGNTGGSGVGGFSLLGQGRFSCVLFWKGPFRSWSPGISPAPPQCSAWAGSSGATSTPFWNASRDSDPTLSWGSCARAPQPFTKYRVNPKTLSAGEKSCCCRYKSNSCILWVPFISSSLMLA